MAGGFSQAFQQDVLQYLTSHTTSPFDGGQSTAWVHLYNTTLTDANTPATTGRCPAADYDPVKVAFTTANWTNPTAADPSVTQNKSEISYTTSAGGSTWGTIKAVQITSSSGTGGVSYYWGDLTSNQTIGAGNVVKFSTGALQISLT